MAEVEETVKRIMSMRGVKGLGIVTSEGIPIRTTMDNETTVNVVSNVVQVMDKASSVIKELDSTNELSMVRLHTKKDEILCANDPNYKLIVIQDARRSDHQGKCD